MIKFLDLHTINARFAIEYHDVFQRFLDSGHYILGNELETFEKAFADYCGSKHCIGTANGLDALILIFKAYIQLGKLRPGDEVIVPANTYIATILSIVHAGLKPVLVEPDKMTFNIAPSEIEKHVSPSTKVVLAVHLYGQLADMVAIGAIAERYGLLLIEDAAQAHGATQVTGHRAGNLGHAAAFSFYPSKNLGCLGDGGAVTTNDDELASCIKKMRNYGSAKKYINDIIGYNSRLDELQAAFLNIKLKSLDSDNALRQGIARRYLSEINNKKILLPFYDGSNNHVFHVFVVRVKDRDGFTAHLDANSIGWLVHYPLPPHRQIALAFLGDASFPVTEEIHDLVVSIPMSPVMTDAEVGEVIHILNRY
ncbi:MAG TPA: DegT/DnrJ/EryC1/StrS family aminotransferase [Aquaticitalea sp.]|nr:DegT/DnrJ/EryC1/StrS family aminotransferase [Aquaticitalea sp.]